MITSVAKLLKCRLWLVIIAIFGSKVIFNLQKTLFCHGHYFFQKVSLATVIGMQKMLLVSKTILNTIINKT